MQKSITIFSFSKHDEIGCNRNSIYWSWKWFPGCEARPNQMNVINLSDIKVTQRWNMSAVVLYAVVPVQNCAVMGGEWWYMTKNIVVCFNLIILRLNFGHRTLTTKVSEGHGGIFLWHHEEKIWIDSLWIIKKTIGAVSSMDVIFLTRSISKLQPCAYFELISTGAKKKCERGFNWIENNFKSEDLAHFCPHHLHLAFFLLTF